MIPHPTQQFPNRSPMAVPPHHFDDDPADSQPGGLLDDLERRQEDVLSQLDDLDAKLSEVLKGLEPTSVDRAMVDSEDFLDGTDELSSEEESSDAVDPKGQDGGFEDFGSAEDWA